LIDALGLKGLRVGGAIVSPKHANFFQAEPGATADDVHALIGEVQRRVLDATGIELVPELRMVGFDVHKFDVDNGRSDTEEKGGGA
jgi:UDP-N-acetylmuramate dehydrogenase